MHEKDAEQRTYPTMLTEREFVGKLLGFDDYVSKSGCRASAV